VDLSFSSFSAGPKSGLSSFGATAQFSTASGYDTTASGINSTAFGRLTIAANTDSTAFGSNTTASGYASTAWGGSTNASGTRSTAFGSNTTASGDTATAWGANTNASGLRSTSWGLSTNASGNYSTSWGRNTTASGNYSTASGYDNIAKSYGETSLGLFSTTGNTGNPSIWVGSDNIFNIGNGTSLSGRSSALTILKYGDVLAPSMSNAIINSADTKVLITKEYADVTYAGGVVTTVGALPAGVVGNRAFVTDSTVAASGNFGVIVAGGNTNAVPVFYDGTNWLIG
jgi:hypothetical protein